MEQDNRLSMPGQTAHHIVQENCKKNPYVSKSRDILNKNNIDVNDSANGAYLWGTHPNQEANASHPGKILAAQQGNRHSGSHVHSADNDKLIYKILKGVDARNGRVEDALRDVGGRMESGSWQESFMCCCGG
jgi:hypothetical protein